MDITTLIGITAISLLMWVGVLHLASCMGGWRDLAKHYQAITKPSGKHFYFRSGSVGIANYGFCLNLCAAEEGLYMSVLFPFRIAHPPLMIPWDQIHSFHSKRIILFRVTECYVGMPVIAHLTLPGWFAVYAEQVNHQR